MTGFWSVLHDTVTNVTVSTSPSLNIRQRQNAGSMRSAGVEFEADVREFFAKHPVKQGAKQIEQHLERLRVAVLCQERWKVVLRA